MSVISHLLCTCLKSVYFWYHYPLVLIRDNLSMNLLLTLTYFIVMSAQQEHSLVLYRIQQSLYLSLGTRSALWNTFTVHTRRKRKLGVAASEFYNI